jgi:hypothetical protein
VPLDSSAFSLPQRQDPGPFLTAARTRRNGHYAPVPADRECTPKPRIVGDRRGMAAMGIWRRHTLRDDQGRRSQADSTATRRVCRRSIIGTRPGGHGKRARCRCGAPYRAVPGPCQDLERDAGSHRMLLVTSQRRAEGRADERFSAPPAPHGRRPDRYPLPPPRPTFPGRLLPGPLRGPPAQRPSLTPGHAAGAARPWPSVENQRLHRPHDRPGRRPRRDALGP